MFPDLSELAGKITEIFWILEELSEKIGKDYLKPSKSMKTSSFIKMRK